MLAGSASTPLQAQEKAGNVVQSPPAQRRAPPAPAPTETVPSGPRSAEARPAQDISEPTIEFQGADGEALSPEIQRELLEQVKKDPPPVDRVPPSITSPAAAGSNDDEVVVTGQRPRGSVVGDLPPERTFSPIDIRAYGVNDIEELLDTVRPQVSSDRGRDDGDPVVLLNGKRVSSFAEIAKIPTEAIERMEVFPEELSLEYGYPADQKVVNVVTFERYNSGTGQLSHAMPTEGGRDTAGIDASYLRIRNDTRFNFDADYDRARALLESERDLARVSGARDDGRFRTLLPQTERLALTGTVSGNLLRDVSATLNGRFQTSDTRSLLGLAGDQPLTRDTEANAIHLGTSLSGSAGRWLWFFTGNYDRATADTFTDAGGALEIREEARLVNALADGELVFSGSVLNLPAGPVSMSLRGGAEFRDFRSRSLRGGDERRADFSRDRGAVQASLDVPIARRRKQPSSWLGNLSANANIEVEELSDIGTLRTFGYGLNWSPVEAISVIASVTDEEGPPTVEQLGAPLVVTPNVRTYDFIRREAIDVTRVFGGNPDLRSDNRDVVRLALNAKPFQATDITFNIDYIRTRIEDPIAPFPIATPEIEAAFPERFTRDRDGRLVRIDSRPLNFQRSDQEQMRWGVNFTRPLGLVPPGSQNANVRFVSGGEAGLQAAIPPGARIVRPEAGSAAAKRVENLTSRLIFSIYHTWRFTDELLVREGVPVLDLLDGSAIGGRGGRPRHELELQAGAFKGGLGARITAAWQSGTVVRGLASSPGGSTGDLRFSDFASLNLNLFANLADRFGGARAPNWLRGTRITIGIDNLFNRRPRVRDDAGSTPFNYQPTFLDPLGRSLSFGLRKIL
ncbi:TonB-dependent receptor [Sphingomonas qomolangmaensis]|uniref:TonB-dependent receptor n=1 Tax=Sphingomonas qomolangmaensis TaxID=2918765 RepID=A0ABY5LEN6_9SPHN|nr:TonB-dependent receptor [Sphingomonas qomolangmaensis]UUL83176.1 TonB-dependent receptor [Sphingomonas qomolangmaensis]